MGWIEECGCDLPAYWGCNRPIHLQHAHCRSSFHTPMLQPCPSSPRRIPMQDVALWAPHGRDGGAPHALLCSLLHNPIPLQLVTAGSRRGMNQQVGFKNQSNPPFQGQSQVELHRVFSKRPPEPFCSSLLSPCSSQCTCERNN